MNRHIAGSLCAIAAIGALAACNNKSGTTAQDANTATATAAPAAAAAPGHAPNPSKTSPPSKAFAQYELIDTPKFYSTQQFTVFNPNGMPGTVDSVQYNYVYADGRFAASQSYNTDVTMQIFKFGSAEQASAFLAKAVAESVPIANAASVKLPKCVGQKSDSDDFVGPMKLVKKIAGAGGKELFVMQPGDHNMYDCQRAHDPGESVLWTDGQYYFAVNASGMKMNEPSDGRAEELALDYLGALDKRR